MQLNFKKCVELVLHNTKRGNKRLDFKKDKWYPHITHFYPSYNFIKYKFSC
jgi:hypothetical protein